SASPTTGALRGAAGVGLLQLHSGDSFDVPWPFPVAHGLDVTFRAREADERPVHGRQWPGCHFGRAWVRSSPFARLELPRVLRLVPHTGRVDAADAELGVGARGD